MITQIKGEFLHYIETHHFTEVFLRYAITFSKNPVSLKCFKGF